MANLYTTYPFAKEGDPPWTFPQGKGGNYPFGGSFVTIDMHELAATYRDIMSTSVSPGARADGGLVVAVEESLVLASQQGDLSAFAGIYDAHYTRVYRYVLVRVGNTAEAEDLAGEVFLRALESLSSYKQRGLPFGAWLFRIAHNLVVDHVRRKAKRPTTQLEDDLPLLGDAPDDLVAMGLTMDDARKAMLALTDNQRQVLALRFGGGLSLAETAQAMGKNENAIKAMQHSAIGAMRRGMTKMGYETPT